MLAVIPLIFLSSGGDDTPIQERLFTLGVGLVLFGTAGYSLHRGYRAFPAWVILGAFILVSLSTIFDYNYWTALSAVFVFIIAIYAQLVLRGRQLWLGRLIVLVLAILPLMVGEFDPATVTDLNFRFSTGFTVIPLGTGILLAIVMLRNLVVEYERNLAEIKGFASTLEKTVEERTYELQLAKLDLELALKKAVEADQLKSQFLASMSHELRTPLNSILTFSELLGMGTFGDVTEEQADYLQKILFSGRHLLALINDVLDISKMESGMMKLFIENDFDVAKEVNQISAAVEKMVGDKPVELVLDIDPEFPLLAVDKRRVRQILLNLLSNAVKFTEYGTVTLSAKKKPNEILFAVSDTGPGIPFDKHEVIFEPFVQTETGIQHAGGTGLGLPISKGLVEAHGGRLWLKSQVGEGASFFFTLPITPVLQIGDTAVQSR